MHYARPKKEIRKTEKEKKKENKNRKGAPGETFRPRRRSSPQPT
jgi:hypothetical protein